MSNSVEEFNKLSSLSTDVFETFVKNMSSADPEVLNQLEYKLEEGINLLNTYKKLLRLAQVKGTSVGGAIAHAFKHPTYTTQIRPDGTSFVSIVLDEVLEDEGITAE